MTDHAKQRDDLLERAMQSKSPEFAQAAATLALVHQTALLTEQQRIGNLIALSRIETENNTTPTDALDAIYSREEDAWEMKLHTRPEIKKALGLS